MKWLNPGFVELFDYYTMGVTTENSNLRSNYAISNQRVVSGHIRKLLEAPTYEAWFQMDCRIYDKGGGSTYFYIGYLDQSEAIDKNIANGKLPVVLLELLANDVLSIKVSQGFHSDRIIYNPQVVLDMSDAKYHNLELHMKVSDEGSGRMDFWVDHKLKFSYRSPSQFQGKLGILSLGQSNWLQFLGTSMIFQDTGRIGMERFCRLDTDKPTEQQFLAGTSTDFVLSNYPEGTEYEDITGVCVAFQGTSRDSAITEGKFTLDGADLGTIDVSDSSGRAWELANAEVNSKTGEKWRREDIEGKTLSFLVGGDW